MLNALINVVSRIIFVAEPPFILVEPVIGSGPTTGVKINPLPGCVLTTLFNLLVTVANVSFQPSIAAVL